MNELCWKNSTSRARLYARLYTRKNFPRGYFQSYKDYISDVAFLRK